MWGPPSAARARGSGAANNPTWQLFTPAWHVPLWSDRALSFKVPSTCTFPRMPAAKLGWCPFGGWHHTNDHGWLFKRSPRFTDGIYREAGLFLRTPFTRRGATELIIKPCPLATQLTCTLDPLRSVQLMPTRQCSGRAGAALHAGVHLG